MVKINFQDKMIEGDEVDVLTSDEKWNEYQLANGTVLLVKAVLVRVFKAREPDPNGAILYLTNTQQIVKVREVGKKNP
jgi:hypothetical protein